MQRWFRFCTDKVDKIERVWNRKLELPEQTDSEQEDCKEQDEPDGDHEQTIEDMFKNFNANRLSR